MATIPNDTVPAFTGIIKINGLGEGFTEEYHLKGASWDAAFGQMQMLSYWRASILGRNVVVDSAIISRLGASRASKMVIDSPLGGTIGVKFDEVSSSATGVNCNTLGTGLRFRFEDLNGLHLTRNFRGVIDSWVNNRQWYNTPMDKFDLGDYKTAIDPADEEKFPSTDLYNFTTPQTGAALAALVSYPVAWQYFLACVFQYTSNKMWSYNSDGKVIGVSGEYPWEKMHYRRVKDRAAGRPSAS